MSKHKRIIVPFLFFVNLVFSNFAFNQSHPTTNEEILRNTFVSQALKQIVKFANKNQQLVIKISDNSLINKWFIQSLSDSCLTLNYFVYSSPDSVRGSYQIVEISGAKAVVSYHSQGRRWLFWSKDLSREISSEFKLKVSNSQNRLLFSKTYQKIFSDQIPTEHRVAVENVNLPFTQGTKKESVFIRRWLEPAIATITTMSVVYLFYMMRSES